MSLRKIIIEIEVDDEFYHRPDNDIPIQKFVEQILAHPDVNCVQLTDSSVSPKMYAPMKERADV